MRPRLIALTVSAALLVIGGSAAPAFAQSSADQSAGNTGGSQASNGSTTNQGAGQTQSSGSSCTAGCGGSGQAQATLQSSSTDQSATSTANANQNAVNANVPVSVSGSGVSVGGGSSSADQTLSNSADSSASNNAETTQSSDQTQESSSGCSVGCGGSGQAQALGQSSETSQRANSSANANQNGVNANVPVSIAGGDVNGGNSSATQDNTNSATSDASNDATTEQDASQSQSSSSSCSAGCGGSGQAQLLGQSSSTYQDADSEATADQNGVNANVPVSVAGGDVYGGDSSASQNLTNSADSTAYNSAETTQSANQSQSSSSECLAGCGGSGQAQLLVQDSSTDQYANSSANAYQNGVNANVPVSIAGGDVEEGDSSADQTLDNSATSDASNYATTDQTASQTQDSSDSCVVGCGGSGQFQAAAQIASTYQDADSDAYADQNGVNANAPVSTGFIVFGGDSSATQDATNSADSEAYNDASTTQDAEQSQSSSSDCVFGCGGSGQAQLLLQAAETEQYADSEADAFQNAVNANVPVSTGFIVDAGDSSADQTLDNSATSDASNLATTDQGAEQAQDPMGGSGQLQLLLQLASTYQDADSVANAYQNAVNANAGATED